MYLVSMYFLSSGSAAPTTSLVTWLGLGSGLGLALWLGLGLALGLGLGLGLLGLGHQTYHEHI